MGGAGGTNGRLIHLTFPRASAGGGRGEEVPGISTCSIVAFLVMAVKKVQGSRKMSDLTARGNVF